MKRRALITLLGGMAAWPALVAKAQQAKLPTIGFLGAASPSIWVHWVTAFVQRLGELGWIERRTVEIDYRWAEGRTERFAAITSEFALLNVDVIVTAGTAPVLAAKQATSLVPIAFAAANDPVRSGLVASLARPGGNTTGLSVLSSDLAGKRLEVAREVIPRLSKLAVLANPDNPGAIIELDEVLTAAGTLGIEVKKVEVRRAEDITPAIDRIRGAVEAIYVGIDPLVNANRTRINALALDARLPTIHGFRAYVEAGGLISYGADFPDMWRRAAEYVDKILRGIKPADLPVQQPTKFELAINLKTAKALGLEVPPMLLARADAVIE